MTNEPTKPADEMKDVAAGAIPDQTSTTAEPRPPANDPGKTLDTSALNTAAAGSHNRADPPDMQRMPGVPDRLADDVDRHDV